MKACDLRNRPGGESIMVSPEPSPLLESMLGKTVVVDLISSYVCLGDFVGCDAQFIELRDADLHDFRDSSATREIYVHDSVRLASAGIGLVCWFDVTRLSPSRDSTISRLFDSASARSIELTSRRQEKSAAATNSLLWPGGRCHRSPKVPRSKIHANERTPHHEYRG